MSKTLIYQYWDGTITSGNQAGIDFMKEYATRIGSDYYFDNNPLWLQKQGRTVGRYDPIYSHFRIIYDESFHKYDKILYADTDVIPTKNLTENIFDEIRDDTDIMICEEWQQPEMRKKHDVAGINHKNDLKWADIIENNWEGIKVPRTEDGSIRVYNAGVLLWTKKGLKKAKEKFEKIEEYVSLIRKNKLPEFYVCDQPYICAMLEVGNFTWKKLDYKWNSSVHYIPETKGDKRPVNDLREKDNTNFVHIQLRGADNWNKEKIWRITNLPVNEWKL